MKKIKQIYQNITNITAGVSADHVGAYAAQTSYFFMLCMIPIILLLLTMVQYTPVTKADVMTAVIQVFPSSVDSLITSIVNQVYNQSTGVIPITIVVALWSAGKGVLAVPTVYGNTLIGPNALECDRDDVSTTSQGLQAVRVAITKTLKDIPMNHNIRTFAGIRATSSRHDFIIEEVRSAPGFIDVAGIESPGLASAPAIVSKIVHDFVEPYLHPHTNESASHTVEPPVIMNELSMEQQNEMIRRNPLYGKIVCRCENVSEQEIIDCMHRPVPATTIKGVKKRVRPGMGRCQGGFCQPYVLRILAQQNGKKKTEICMDEPGSCILVKENRL